MNCLAQRWRIGGHVQGVGFRPYVYRLAHQHGLAGWVRNDGGLVEIHAQGPADQLQTFGAALLQETPASASARLIEVRPAAAESRDDFRILDSTSSAETQVHVPVDLANCDECLAELRDPCSRRHRHPFINCTQCGPRYTLIRQMPYDRINTTLQGFALCAACAQEYADPCDRRFHAQPLACPACGPELRWGDRRGIRPGNEAALAAALAALRAGLIVAVRGVGGYHLLCDAASDEAVARLRLRKGRPLKPLAVMVPLRGEDGLDAARALAMISPQEKTALRSAVRPIVLVQRRAEAPLAAGIAPGLRALGLMLPYSPLHHLLTQEFAAALVATSGNLSGEPVLTAPDDAEARLRGVADGDLHHNRDIARHADDPVIRVTGGRARPLRLGRGNTPLEMDLAAESAAPTLAVGAYMKNTVALAWGRRAVVSAHIGDLDSPRGRDVFGEVAEGLQQLYGVRAERIVHDAHRGFPNSRWAVDRKLPTLAVWHHHAHAAAVAGEFPGDGPLLCFTWDGLGLGPDQTLWGGEALLGGPGDWRRVASFRPFRLPGGERAAREPWRSALALCWETGTPWPAGELLADPLLRKAFDAGLNAPATSSVGRLFDAAAAQLGTCAYASFDGEAPMRLEALCERRPEPLTLPLQRDAEDLWRSDWAPLVPAMLDEREPRGTRAALFHATLAAALCAQAQAIRQQHAVQRVGLCGGVFQNRVLTDHARTLLRDAGFEVLIPRRLPVNDAAISFGQLIEGNAPHAAYCCVP
jgi:hydrogenase maturation protein HypF